MASGASKLQMYYIGPKERPIFRTVPYTDQAQTFDKLYPGHNKAEFWEFFFPGIYGSCRAAILDGEVIVAGEQGAPDYPALEAAIWNEPSRLVFVAFDILHLDGRNLAPLPLLQRKHALWQLVEPGAGKIRYSEHFDGDALAILRAIDKMGLEGIISKRADSRYRSGPSTTCRGWTTRLRRQAPCR